NGGLKAETVVPLLASEDADLKKAANWVASHHSEWGGALAGYFGGRLKEVKESDRSDLERQLAQFARSQEIQELIVSSLNQPTSAAKPIPINRMECTQSNRICTMSCLQT